jgi:hypothetical protein
MSLVSKPRTVMPLKIKAFTVERMEIMFNFASAQLRPCMELPPFEQTLPVEAIHVSLYAHVYSAWSFVAIYIQHQHDYPTI